MVLLLYNGTEDAEFDDTDDDDDIDSKLRLDCNGKGVGSSS